MSLVRRVGKRFFVLLPLIYTLSLFTAVSQQFITQYSAAVSSGTSAVSLPNGREVGGDFITFYVAGQIFREDPAKTYDIPLQLQKIQELVAGSGVKSKLILPFVYPPPLAALFSRLAGMELLPAYFTWLGFSIACCLAGMAFLLNSAALPRGAAAYLGLLAIGFAPLILDCLAAGQTSCLGIFILGLTYFLLRRDSDLAAGAVLGLGCYKPPLFALVLIGLMFEKRWRVLLGFFLSAAVFNAVSALLIGVPEYLSYLNLASHYRYGEIFGPNLYLPVYLGVGGYSILCRILDPSTALPKILYAGAIALAMFWYWTQTGVGNRERFASRFAALLALSLWLSPQMNSYDIAIALVPLVLTAGSIDWRAARFRPAELFFIFATILVFTEWQLREIFGGQAQFVPTAAAFTCWVGSVIVLARRRGVDK